MKGYVISGLNNGEVQESQKRHCNQLGQPNQYKLIKFVEGLGQAEVLLMTKRMLSKLTTKNLGFSTTEMNVRGALKVLGWRTSRIVSAKKMSDKLTTPGRKLAMSFYYLKKNINVMREENIELHKSVRALAQVVTDLIEKLR